MLPFGLGAHNAFHRTTHHNNRTTVNATERRNAMQQAQALQPNHFAHLFGGLVVEEALKKAESWNEKSRVCRPLDCPNRSKRSADLAKFDASIDDEADDSED